ncbi:MAG: type II toxin-antitoxin system VapC family toxin [Thaumarchaeota archaeon]|nr:type II toxin-antitoxin system VapC family toxin [Nitrososphaerota archaeon]
MERGKIAVDASVVVKWFVEEKYSKEALIIRDSFIEGLVDIVVPSLLYFEVLNALKYSGAFGEDELKKVARILEDYQFTLYELEGAYAEKAVEIAMRKGITIYDASYVALALIEGVDLYTADEKLLTKTQDLKITKHLKNFKI